MNKMQTRNPDAWTEFAEILSELSGLKVRNVSNLKYNSFVKRVTFFKEVELITKKTEKLK